jgi:hypothetical protein
MSPSCARCAPTRSDASLVPYYGQSTAWEAPACLHAAACADRNRVTLSTQLADRSARAPQLLGSGVPMAMDQCQSLCEGLEAARGPGAASPNVVCEAPAPCAQHSQGAPPSHSGPCQLWMYRTQDDRNQDGGQRWQGVRVSSPRKGVFEAIDFSQQPDSTVPIPLCFCLKNTLSG